jgi:hypothetical protein
MFLLGMREHHEVAIEMGNIALEKARSEEILSQAETMVRTQQAEQEEFAGYLQDFYGIEAPEATGDMERAMQLAMTAGSSSPLPETGGAWPPGSSAVLAGALLALAAVGGLVLRRGLGR